MSSIHSTGSARAAGVYIGVGARYLRSRSLQIKRRLPEDTETRGRPIHRPSRGAVGRTSRRDWERRVGVATGAERAIAAAGRAQWTTMNGRTKEDGHEQWPDEHRGTIDRIWAELRDQTRRFPRFTIHWL